MTDSKPIFMLLRPEEVLQAVANYAKVHRGLPDGQATVHLLAMNDANGTITQYRLEVTYYETPA